MKLKENIKFTLRKNLDIVNENFIVKKGTDGFITDKVFNSEGSELLSVSFANIHGDFLFNLEILKDHVSQKSMEALSYAFNIADCVIYDDKEGTIKERRPKGNIPSSDSAEYRITYTDSAKISGWIQEHNLSAC